MSARRKFLFDWKQLTSFCKKFKAEFDSFATTAVLEVNHDDLERRWTKVLESFEQNMLSDDAEDTIAQDDSTNKFDEATEIYKECKAMIVQFNKHKFSQNAHESTRTEGNMSFQTSTNLKLPPCDTQPFEGGYSRWPAFRDIFKAVFINHPGLSDAQKLYHLRSKTRGEALQIVQRYDLVDKNFNIAWEALKTRYENHRILVHQQMKKLFGLQIATCETPKSIRQIQSGINDSISIFNSYKIKTDNWDPILVHWCSTKLPEETLRAWEDSLTDHKELPSWSQMDKFLSKRIEILETLTDLKKPNQKDNSHTKSQSFYSQTNAEKKYLCKNCKQNHPLRFCKHFISLSPNERSKYVYANKYCSNCLSPNHFKPQCPSTKKCAKCDRPHHTMLHFNKHENKYQNHGSNLNNVEENNTYENTATYSENKQATKQEIQLHFAQNTGTTVLPTALMEIVHAGEKFLIRALLDAGSEKSFLSKRMQEKLRLPVERHNTKISGLGGTIVGNSQGKCNVTIKARESDFFMEISTIIVLKIAHFLPSKRVHVPNFGKLSTLNLADPYFYNPSPIDMIIGSDYLPQINMKGVRFDIAKGVEARESKFGWYLSGPMPVGEVNSFSTIISDSNDSALHEQMRKFWEIEEIGKPSELSENDLYCEEFYKRTTYRQQDGRYVVRLPFRPEYPQELFLGCSKNIASAQYHRMEKTLEKSPDLKAEYKKVLQEYIELDHMEQIEYHEQRGEKQSSFFLPHHAVIKPDSTSTKVRVVFNGSNKTTSGFSLNQVLLPGPTLLADLMQIVLSWRFYEFVFTGDIQKMYRQILLHPQDRKYQLVLFRPEENVPVKTFQLKTVTFGINCAPFLAIRTLMQLSEDCLLMSNPASEILKNEIYVDDVLSGGHTLDETKEKQIDLLKILKSAGFPLKKITANNNALLENLAREDLLDEDFLKFDESSTTKTLGIRWNAKTDTFFYKVEIISYSAVTTKKQILSVIARLYDPLGWLGPVIIIAKKLMQSLWQEKVDWDEPVRPELLITWKTFIENLPKLEMLTIPRWIGFSPGKIVQVHGFCDASEKAYCGAIYIRVSDQAKITSNLLVAKTRVAPLKGITIPKLELCGALLLAKLMKSLNIRCSYESFLWTDSSIVLGWLQKSPQTLKVFVANRVTEINRISDINSWRHVKTEDNPADIGTRGCTPLELKHNSLWWYGPSWLLQPTELWPKPRIFDPTDLETKKIKSFHLEVKVNEFIERFSSFNKAIRVVCQIFRFIWRCQKIPVPEELSLSTEEVTSAKQKLIILAQKTFYSREYKNLQCRLSLSTKSSILTLTPFLDKDGLMRVGGRLSNTGLSYDERHPILIPDKSHFSYLLIKYTHEILLHAEHQVMLRAIRQGFYIPRLRNAIRKCIRGCRICTIYKQRFQSQVMAALPPERVTFSLPFTYTGVDFAGPFSIKSSYLRNAKLLKGYAAVFVCFSTRAVHLETCSDLSTDAFLAAFATFIGRRGLPKTLFSDNGRNFVGASRKLLQEHGKFLKSVGDKLAETYSTQGLNWTFIPPYAPHMGGIWEAAVKSMKSHLKKVALKLNFTFEEFTTLLVRIEAILNSRPLCSVTEDPDELLPLTPGHFLRGAPLTAPPESPTMPASKSLSYINRWQRLKILLHIFSQRWKAEYVTELQKRQKWKTNRNNLKEGDFVIVKEDLLPPMEWCLGRITKVFYGNDNNVRVAEIKTKNGIIVRSIVKLCLLPTTEPNSFPKATLKTDI